MKSKLILAALALPMFCLASCSGGANNLYGKTVNYVGAFSGVDEAYNSEIKTTARQFLEQNFESNIDWDGSSLPTDFKHGSVAETISSAEAYCTKKIQQDYGSTKIVFGSESEKKATVTFGGETKVYTVTDSAGMIYDIKDSKGETAFEYQALGLVNGKATQGVLIYINAFYARKYCSSGLNLNLKTPVQVTETSQLSEITLMWYANFTN